MRLPDR
ncbi:hypothetical protein CJF32_00003936 [Rutstroemia sp. NJR-2017a WRK4]|nr:hypothetical protein CJF32_00003936 [Rutstroemia sp. NJR-2017a WRK4]